MSLGGRRSTPQEGESSTVSIVAPIQSHAPRDVEDSLGRAGRRAARAKAARDEAFAALADEVRAAIAAGMTEVDAARLAQVDRMTVRKWVGKAAPRPKRRTSAEAKLMRQAEAAIADSLAGRKPKDA